MTSVMMKVSPRVHALCMRLAKQKRKRGKDVLESLIPLELLESVVLENQARPTPKASPARQQRKPSPSRLA
jgi:hypothetical protein